LPLFRNKNKEISKNGKIFFKDIGLEIYKLFCCDEKA